MNSDGSNQNPLMESSVCSMPENQPPFPTSLPSWNPNGTKIAFAGWIDEDDSFNIYVVSISGTPPKRLTDDDTFWDVYAAWSPDGTKIAFQSERSGNWDIWVVNPDGSGLRQLTEDGGDDIQPAWSSDNGLCTCTCD